MRALMPIMKPSIDGMRALNDANVFLLLAVPMEMMAPHDEQMRRNHFQSFDEAARRGGLSACEAVAVLEDRPYRQMNVVNAYRRLNELFQTASAAA